MTTSNYNQFGINKNTYNLLFENDHIGPLYFNNKDTYNPIIMINLYTMKKRFFVSKLISKEFCSKILKIKYKIIKIDDSNKLYIYDDNKQKLEFKLFSDMCDDDKEKRKLLSSKRKKRCHEMSIVIASNLDNSKMVSGICKIHSNDNYLHSWVEYTKDNCEYVIDYTNNLVMKKDAYYKLMYVKVINSIKKEELSKELKLLNNYKIPMGARVYCFFNSELIKEYQKIR